MRLSRLFKVLSVLIVVTLACQCSGAGIVPTPTAQPAASPTPRTPYAPIVGDHFPAKGDELPVNGSVDVYFDQPMDQASVAAAFSISPAVTGTFTWLDDSTVRFTPAAPLERASRYTVTVGGDAKSKDGLPMGAPYTFNADTVGFLEVTQVLPAPDTQQVEVNSAITVMFNRPVVALGLSGQTGDLPNPLTLDPPVPGTGEWLNTSIFVFHPQKPLAGSVTYRATIKGGLTDTTGGLLKDDFSWTFSTLPPAVVNVEPTYGALDVSLTQPISATFNQPMDIVSTQGAFSLNDAGGNPAPGSFKWNDDHTVLTFTPQGKLRLGAAYTAALSTAARAADGQTPLADALTWTFNTVLFPAVLNTDPGNGGQIDTYYGFRIFFASPMDEKTLANNITISPEAKVGSTYYSDSDKSYYVSFDFAPSTAYTVTLGPDMADPYGNRVGATTTVAFTTRPYEPLFQFNTRGDVGLYSAYMPTALYVTYRNFDNLHFSFYRMTTGDFAKWTGNNGYSFRQGYQPTDVIREWTASPEQFINENAYLKVPLTEDGSALPPGLYYLRAEGPGGYPLEHALVVSKYNLTLKVGFDSALVWATDQQSGQPVAGLPVTLYDETFNSLATGITDSDGLFRASIDPSAMPNLWTALYALSPEGDAFAAVQSQWSAGVDAWDFNQSGNYYPRTDTTYLYTDRPVYRPGQVVSFRGIARAEHDARFTLPDIQGIDVTITNDQGEEVYTKTLPLSPYGAFADQFTLSDAAGTGNYNINTTTGGDRYQANLSFQVAEYHKPEFLVNVTADKPAVVQGDTIHALVESTFFFGGPVSNANVQWTLLAANSFFQYNGPGYYDFTDFDYTSGEGTPYYGSFGEVIASGTGVTDGQGKLAINVPADIGKKTASQLFTLEATVTDINGQSVSGRTSVTVHQGDFYVGIGPDQFVGRAGQPSRFNLLTVGWGGEPYPGRQVKVTYYLHEWFNVQEQDEFGNKIWTWSAKDTQVAEDTVTTDADGKAVSSFTPAAGGTYRAVATAADSGGRTVRSAAYIWVTSGEFISWRQDNNNRIALVPDRKQYRPGDTAEILIPSPFQGETQALLTVERGGIYKTERLTLTSNSTVYRLPITSDYAPDVYVSVVIVKGVDDTNPAPAFRAGLAHLKVSPEEQRLTVTITPDKSKVGPRDTVTYKVHAADHNGQAVQAELSAGLADLAALSLAAPNSGPILDAFYGERGLSVRTAVGLTLSVDQLNTQTASIKGGGGGAESGFVVVRGDFRDTAYWNPSVVTDANGDAAVSIKLPDNLTTWRLDVRGVTADTLVGQNTVDIVATKDLLIRPATPRFFVVGDQAELAAVVNNNTADDLTVDVTLSGSGFTLADPAKQTVTVKANDRARVQWSATIADAPAADLTFTAVSGALSDASKPPLGNPPDQLLPIYKYSAPETVATAGVLDGQSTATELIALPRRYDASQGRLSVELSPSLAAGMTAGLDYLEHYPYECTEQTISRFLPNVLTYRALQKLGISDPALEARLTSLVNAGAQRLYSKQHPDGGWGWWVTDESNAFITAYALFGLNRAKEAGFNITQS
ncbi:MAG: Ig-like domain-containing protein, partial [Chloroflexi bacterium]|nr:Ig-like domain-containing protein [Chloroflexota bacterium]